MEQYTSTGVLLLVCVWQKFMSKATKKAQMSSAAAFAKTLLGATKDDYGMIPEKLRKKEDETSLILVRGAFEGILTRFLNHGDLHVLDTTNDSAKLLARYYYYEEATFDAQNIKCIEDFIKESASIALSIPPKQGYDLLTKIGTHWANLKVEYVYKLPIATNTSANEASILDTFPVITPKYHYALYYFSKDKKVTATYMGVDDNKGIIIEFENANKIGKIDTWIGSYTFKRQFWFIELSPQNGGAGREYYILEEPYGYETDEMPIELNGLNLGIGLEKEGRPVSVHVFCRQIVKKESHEELQKGVNDEIKYRLNNKRHISSHIELEILVAQVQQLRKFVGCYELYVLSSTNGPLKLDVAKCEVKDDFSLIAESINEGSVTKYTGHLEISTHAHVCYAHFYPINKNKKDHYFISILVPSESEEEVCKKDLHGCYAGFGLSSTPRGGRDYWHRTSQNYDDMECRQIVIDEHIKENPYIKSRPFLLPFFSGKSKSRSDFFVSDFSVLGTF